MNGLPIVESKQFGDLYLYDLNLVAEYSELLGCQSELLAERRLDLLTSIAMLNHVLSVSEVQLEMLRSLTYTIRVKYVSTSDLKNSLLLHFP